MTDALSFAPYSRSSTTALAIARIAARQWGVVSREQLLQCGVSGSVISRWVASGRLHRLHRGVYALGHTNLPYEGRLVAALFAHRTGAGLGHATAAHWWRTVDRSPAEIHICVASRHRPGVRGVRLHHPRRLEVVRHRRLPVTSLPTTLIDYASTHSVNEVRAALAQADFRNILDLGAVRSVLGRGRPGSRTLTAALEAHLPLLARAANELEREFLLICEQHAIELPAVNVWIGRKRVDALWPDERLVVELDSRAAHGSEARRITDHKRDLELRALGYRVRRYSWYQVFFTPTDLAADLSLALAEPPRIAAAAPRAPR